jgi:hypothetical protein
MRQATTMPAIPAAKRSKTPTLRFKMPIEVQEEKNRLRAEATRYSIITLRG